MMEQKPTRATVDQRYRGLLIVWFMLLAAVGIFFALTRLLNVPVSAGNNTLRMVFGVLGGADFALSFVLKRTFLSRAVEQQRPDYVTTAYVVACALCETVAIFALVNYFVSGTTMYLLFILAAVGLLLHFPRRAPLEAAGLDSAPQPFDSTLR